MFDGLREHWEPRPWNLRVSDLITGALVVVNILLWPFILWAVLT